MRSQSHVPMILIYPSVWEHHAVGRNIFCGVTVLQIFHHLVLNGPVDSSKQTRGKRDRSFLRNLRVAEQSRQDIWFHILKPRQAGYRETEFQEKHGPPY